jgi:integrase
MPRRAKGPRLYLKQRKGREAVWIIRDGTAELSTGCGASSLPDAERRLAGYIARKWAAEGADAARNKRDPAQVKVAEVLALYALEKAPTLKADQKSTAGFIRHLLLWWGGERTIADVKRSTCQAYNAHRTAQPIRHGNTGRMISDQTVRRELETLNAAIGYWHGEHPLFTRPQVWLPEKAESPRDALSRSEAAALLWAAMGWRKGSDGRWTRENRTTIANRRHLRSFILIGLYTGSRSGVIKALLWHESAKQAWVDLDDRTVYRRGKQERDTKNKRRPLVKLTPRLTAHMARWQKIDAKDARKPNTVLHFGGQPVGAVRKAFGGCVADAGLASEVTPHWLRHTAATWLMERDTSPWEAAGYLGMSTKVLEDHYGHHRPDHQSGAVRALGGKR